MFGGLAGAGVVLEDAEGGALGVGQGGEASDGGLGIVGGDVGAGDVDGCAEGLGLGDGGVDVIDAEVDGPVGGELAHFGGDLHDAGDFGIAGAEHGVVVVGDYGAGLEAEGGLVEG